MKKVLSTMSKYVGGIFSLAVLALLMSLTYGALQRIFPGNFINQMWGLVMFDIAAMCWALIFVFQSSSVGQYAAAGIGFLVGFVGTLGMVAAEVMLSGQNLAQIDTGEIGKWMIYGFIIVTALHAALVYAHHGTAPEIAEQINVGVARGEVVSQAITDAAKTIEAEKHELSQAIYNDIVSRVKRDLGLHPVDGTVFDRRRTYQQATPSPVVDAIAAELPKYNHLRPPHGNRQHPHLTTPDSQTVPIGVWQRIMQEWDQYDDAQREQAIPVTWARQEDATATARPLSARFRDWVNGLRTPQAAAEPAAPNLQPAPEAPQHEPTPEAPKE